MIQNQSNLKFDLTEQHMVTKNSVDQGVVADHIIALESSTRLWQLINFITLEGERYQYLTNDVDLEPGVITFLYRRRWDIENVF
ncbi:MAG: hypothetical protein GXP17_09195 [Gammaproteobacteria bacterium]|nr:hypothetical protein [Gammaproteobacteria bacterium]